MGARPRRGVRRERPVRTGLEKVGGGFIAVDGDWRITALNERAERDLGRSRDELLGQRIWTAVPELRDSPLHEGLQCAIAESLPVRCEPFPLQSSRWFEAYAYPTVDGGAAYLQDVTERRRTEDELRHTNHNLRALIRAAPLGIVAIDARGRIETWNPAAERILGWTEGELLGRPYPAVPEDRLDELQLEIEAAMRGESLIGIETERVRKDGRRVAVNISTAPVRGPGGEPRGMMALIEDISDRKQAEEARRRLLAILEATPDFVSTADPQGHPLYMNRKGREMLGVYDEDLSGRTIQEFHPAWAASLIMREAIPAAIRDGIWSGESALLDGHGHEVPVLQVIVAHTDAAGELEYLSTIARDITERKQAEENLKFLAEASRTLSKSLDGDQILELLAGLIVPRLADYCLIETVDDVGSVRRVKLAHRTPDMESLLERLHDFRRLAPDSPRPFGTAQVLRTGRPELLPVVTATGVRARSQHPEEFRILRRLGPRSQLVVPLTALGRVIGTVTCAYSERPARYTEAELAVVEDLAGRAALALENARLFDQTQQAVRVREEVLRVVAHDLRNPLHTIGMSAELILGTASSEKLEQWRGPLQIIQRSASRANRLIADLLDVGRLEAGMLSVARSPLPTGDLLREVIELHRAAAGAKDIELVADLPARLPEVSADRDRLIQVFGNLLGNAFKFTPAGGRVLLQAEAADSELRFSVSDTGPGIEPEDLKHLFDPFWQARKGSGEGAGLGLGIAKGIVEAHGGRIWIESEPGAGTAVHFTVPVADTPREN